MQDDLLLQEPPPLSVVEQQVSQAEADFEEAKKMFNPWYAGPLLTPGSNNVPPGHFNVQPYLFIINTYAVFDQNRKSRSIPDILTINPSFVYQMGLFKWLDFTVILSALRNSQSGQSSFSMGDTTFGWGIPILKEKLRQPALRFTFSETFPTGRYHKLNPQKNGIDATGEGAYQTTLSLNMSKIFWWNPLHPFRWRLSLNYTIPHPNNVRDFNAYGGGFGTRGKVHPGNKIAIDTSLEWSFTQRWVFAIDLVYRYQNQTSFSGKAGFTPTGTRATIGAPSKDQLSTAPAIQYNPSENLGFLVGTWFTLTGRNAANFASAILTFTYFW